MKFAVSSYSLSSLVNKGEKTEKELIALAKEIVRKRGTIVLKSTYAGTTNIDLSYFVVNEISIVGSRCGPFEPALNLLNRGFVRLPEIELWELKDYEKAFASRAFKTGFKF